MARWAWLAVAVVWVPWSEIEELVEGAIEYVWDPERECVVVEGVGGCVDPGVSATCAQVVLDGRPIERCWVPPSAIAVA